MVEPTDLMLDMMHAIRTDMAGMKADVIEVKERIGLVEGAVASLSRRVDPIGGDVAHIKRRLDSHDEHVGD